MRIVRTTNGVVRIDPLGKMPGRGAYLCGAKECLAQALKTNRLGRALRCEIPEDLKNELQELVARDHDEKQRCGSGEINMEAE